jgi:hypothetical protein
LSEAKLGRLPVFSLIYDLMSAGQNVKDSNGVGSVEVRMENGNLELNNLHYFNRGTEVRGMFTIEKAWMMPHSRLTGTLIGSLRPLASLNLPFVSEIDRLIALLSSDLVSVGVDGTVEKPRGYQIGLKDLGNGLHMLLFGQVPESGDKAKSGNKTGATRQQQSP